MWKEVDVMKEELCSNRQAPPNASSDVYGRRKSFFCARPLERIRVSSVVVQLVGGCLLSLLLYDRLM